MTLQDSLKNTSCCVIIVTYNGEKWIEKCLESILQATFCPKIIVVDNNSKDSTLAIVDKFKEVEVIESNENIGFGKANNIGIKYASQIGYKFFFLVNQDVYVELDTISKLIDSFYRTNFQYGLISPIHLNGVGVNLDAGFEKFMKSRNSSGFYKDYKNGRLSSTVYEVDFVNAAAWMLSSECIDRVGLFHPLFSHYGEDDNYVERVKFLGLKTGVLASTSIRHDRDSRIKNSLRVNYKLRFRRTLLRMLVHPKNYSHTKIFFKTIIILITSRGRWPVLPDPGFCLWGMREFFRQKNIVSKYRDEVENDKN